jgi:hypothetical protein
MTKAKNVILFIAVAAMMAACTTNTPSPQPSAISGVVASTPTMLDTPFVPATNTPAPTATATIAPTTTPSYPAEGYGPTNFPENVDPLTGLVVTDPQILNRRPIIIKVENLPREDRPQYGLSKADIVWEYYTEAGTTRFASVFYGQDADKVMPIRSARYSDLNFIRMYKSIFVFGSAYAPVYQRLANSEYSNELILENSGSCPAVCRDTTNGHNFLSANTAALQDYLKTRGVDNTKQNLDGMYFNETAPAGGQPADQVFVRYSGAIYNRWDYDPTTNRYYRYVDTKNDTSGNDPGYTQLVDGANQKPISANNVVIIEVRHVNTEPYNSVEVLDVSLLGTGTAYLARDGKMYKVTWERKSDSDVLHLIDDQGNEVAFNPGQTWFELMTLNTKASQDSNAWSFQFIADW